MARSNAIFILLRKLNQSFGEILYAGLCLKELDLSVYGISEEHFNKQDNICKIRLVQDKVLTCTAAVPLGECNMSFPLYMEQLGNFWYCEHHWST